MFLGGNAMEGPGATGPVPKDPRPAPRLYPSLPSISKYDAHVPDERAAGEAAETERETAAAAQGAEREASAACSGVRATAQVLLLEEQRQELISINETWAKEYRTMVRYYREKIRDLKAQLQQSHGRLEEEEGASARGGDGRTEAAGKGGGRALGEEGGEQTGDADPSSAPLLRLEKEAEELRAQNSALTRRGQHQREEIRRLNEALEEALQTSPHPGGRQETPQDLWKHQAQVYKEDFLTERKDREKLKHKYLELESRFRKVYRELHALRPQVNWIPSPQPVLECICMSQGKCLRWDVQPANQQLQRRHTVNNKP